MKTRIGLWLGLITLIAISADVEARQQPRDSNLPARDPGSASISGRVTLPSDHPVGTNIKIILGKPEAQLMTLYSDKNGEFRFTNLPAGVYNVQVIADAKLYESIIQQVRVLPGEPIQLNIHLKEKNDPVARETRGNLISVAEAKGRIPDEAKREFDRGRRLVSKGDHMGGISHFNRAIAAYPDYLMARNNLGVEYLKLKRFGEAAEQFEVIIEKDPRYFNARLNLGIVRVEQKRFAEAVDQLKRAIALESSRPAAHLFLGIAALELNDLPVAEKELVKALLFGGENYAVAHYYFAHVYLKTGRREQAERELKIYLESAPGGEMAAHARSQLEQIRAKR